MIQIAFNSYWLSNMVNVQGDANGISGKGCTGACNAVNTTLTTDAQLQNQGEWLLGGIRTCRKAEITCCSLPKSFTLYLLGPTSSSKHFGQVVNRAAWSWSLSLWCLLAFIDSKVIGLSIQPSCLMYPLSACTNKRVHMWRGRSRCFGRPHECMCMITVRFCWLIH